MCCILSKFYIKPQLEAELAAAQGVVSYRNSTSNHNDAECQSGHNALYLIEILHQTTTLLMLFLATPPLYLIEILHQTTTQEDVKVDPNQLYLIEILHQTTTDRYINPPVELLYLIEILHQTTTRRQFIRNGGKLYLIEILHQTTTPAPPPLIPPCCILSKFYIKPQLARQWLMVPCVVSYRNSTSNHNESLISSAFLLLYLIEILHQTTTMERQEGLPVQLYLIEILHQTTTKCLSLLILAQLYLIEILHQTTTPVGCVVEAKLLYLIEILHQTTTV